MRKLETQIRYAKDEIEALRALGGNQATISKYKAKITRYLAEYDKITTATGIDGDVEWKRRMVKFARSRSDASLVASSSSESPITPITDAAIESVKKVSISGFTDEQNDYIQKQHKELLKYARDNNNSNEVAFVYRKDLTGRTIFKGSEDVIDFGNGLNGKGDGLFIMHNHPRNSGFSKTDVGEFVRSGNIKIMSIVRNNGGTEVLVKSETYNSREAFIIQNRFKSKYAPNGTKAEYDKMIQKYLSYCEKKGLIEWIK